MTEDDAIGKVPPQVLQELILSRTGASDDAVLQGPAYGEDTVAIDLGEEVLVVNSDPISLSVDRVGTLGVNVACNDVAASGASPRWLTSVIFLPGGATEMLDNLTRQLDEAATEVGVSIVGGHSEYAPDLSRPTLVLTCMGLTERYVPTGGAEPGDRLILTKGAGIEGTAILASDFRDRLADTVPDAVLDRALAFYDDVSVVPEATLLGPHANAMHDPTEGGLVDGLLEMAVASDVTIEAHRDAIPVREETTQLCDAAGVDPLRIFGSGALVAAVPAEEAAGLVANLRDEGIVSAVVGRVVESTEPSLRIDGTAFDEPIRDDMYDLWT